VRGVCWSTSPNPTVSNSIITNGSGGGSFTISITGLKPNTTYYVRAYATNGDGTSYGNALSFTTTPPIIFITTSSISNITCSSATCGGNITSDAGSTVFKRGVCWSTSATPTIFDSKTTDSVGSGSFISTITGLNTTTTYYVRAYAINSIDTGYGNVISFTTSSPSIGDPYQGGIIAYIFQPGDPGYDPKVFHGLIASTKDQGSVVHWYNGNYTITGATFSTLGTGKANTDSIIAHYGAGNYAAMWWP